MKKFIYLSLMIIATWTFVYLCFAFVNITIDFTKWKETILFIWFLLAILGAIGYFKSKLS